MKLAQLNIALAKYPLDAPEIKEFVDNLDRVNSIAENSDGFVWRFKDESGEATNIKQFDVKERRQRMMSSCVSSPGMRQGEVLLVTLPLIAPILLSAEWKNYTLIFTLGLSMEKVMVS